ncbi:LOW QUALITY PROTEIN: hypothetical protein QTO34_004176 [Cnephaeus nilssonii]|uniref:Jun dimerization protein 2 n=1 Tax=Cnephaeus nilssonii TaxID=3371016 RepID=A0AA40HS45_CNENI|nr:LOW QUALITY PROTEIN: hypothetical protein QTO34_004176 [Eptesicus nilssonii]
MLCGWGGGGVWLAPWRLLSGHGPASMAQAPGLQPLPVASAGLDCHSSCYDILDPSVTADSLPGLCPLTGLPSSALTAEELKYVASTNWGHDHPFAIPVGETGQEASTCEKQGRGVEEKAPGKEQSGGSPMRNKKKEWKEVSAGESEWLELMNAELKTQMEELKQEWKQLILMLNRHHPTCIIRTNSIKTPTQKATHCWSSWSAEKK